MTEESAWQTFSSIKKEEENKILKSKNENYYFNDNINHLNNIHVYDTDTSSTDSEDYGFNNKNYNEQPGPIDTNFITPPKSSVDSNLSSPVDSNSDKEKKTLTTLLNNINEQSKTINKNLTNKDILLKHKVALAVHNKKDKKRGMESAWTKFIKENPEANKNKDKENDLTMPYMNTYKNFVIDEENLENLEILERLSVNSINSINSTNSLTSTGSRNRNTVNTVDDYAFFMNHKNEISAWKVKELAKSSMELLNSDNRSHSHIQKSFLESDISAWRSGPIKEVKENKLSSTVTSTSMSTSISMSVPMSKSTLTSISTSTTMNKTDRVKGSNGSEDGNGNDNTKNSIDNNMINSKVVSNQRRTTFDFDTNVSDSISAWKVDSLKSIEEIIKGYNIKQAIGKGYCGTIYKGINEKTGQPIAVKTEKISEKSKHLEEEYAIYQRLFGVEGMPRVLYYGQLEKDNIMIMELLGPSIENLFRLCHRRFSMKTICMIAKQLITRLEKVHERGIVYRDIKPENFLIGYIDYSKPITNEYPKGEEVYLQDGSIGRPPVSTIYLADFGLSELYKNQVTRRYVPNKKKPPCGTPRYMSLNTHCCDQQTPRDDLEALGYCLLYLCLGGHLPWMGITAKTPEAMIMSIGRTKASISLAQLCKNLPNQFVIYFKYVRLLDFYDKPNYDFLRSLFDDILSNMGQVDDGDFDWIAPIRLHQEQKAKKQRMEREKEMKKVEMGKKYKKREKDNHEKKRKLSLIQQQNNHHHFPCQCFDKTFNGNGNCNGKDNSNSNGNGNCNSNGYGYGNGNNCYSKKKQALSSLEDHDGEEISNKRIHHNHTNDTNGKVKYSNVTNSPNSNFTTTTSSSSSSDPSDHDYDYANLNSYSTTNSSNINIGTTNNINADTNTTMNTIINTDINTNINANTTINTNTSPNINTKSLSNNSNLDNSVNSTFSKNPSSSTKFNINNTAIHLNDNTNSNLYLNPNNNNINSITRSNVNGIITNAVSKKENPKNRFWSQVFPHLN